MEDFEKITTALVVIITLAVVFNSYQINQMKTTVTPSATGNTVATTSFSNSIDVTPKGVPEIYGKELGVSFDDISPNNPVSSDATIKKLVLLDSSITFDSEELKRYNNIASNISCEFCCGATSLSSCKCAHNASMSGLAKYLVKNHGDEYTDDQILEELGKWKTLFFPSKISQKAGILFDAGIDLNYINLASNKYSGIEKGVKSATGGMVGGC